jgi:hypothetical protein
LCSTWPVEERGDVPVPLIPVIVVGVVAAASAVVSLVRPKTVAPLKIAILGRERTGKTTLLSALRHIGPPAEAGERSDGAFDVKDGENAIQVEVLKDVDGAVRAKFTDWKSVFLRAEAVIYLFRADLIHAKDAKHIRSVKSDLDVMKDWADGMKSDAPRIILVGTWGDQDPLFGENSERFAKSVRASDPIKLGRAKYSKKAPVYVGSLLGDHSSTLIDDVVSGLVILTRRSKRGR